jgi:hypothetical protein
MMRNTTKKRNIIFTVITIMLIGVMVVVAGCGEKNNSDPQGNKSKPSKLNMMGMRFGAMEVISKNMTEAGKGKCGNCYQVTYTNTIDEAVK